MDRVAPQSAQLAHRCACRLHSRDIGELPPGNVHDRRDGELVRRMWSR